MAGLLAAALAAVGFAMGGAPVAVLAPAIFWFTPRTLSLGLLATPDLLGALLWLVAVQAYARALAAPTRLARTRAGLWSAACSAPPPRAVRPDLASVWLVLMAHWGLGRFHLRWLARANQPGPAVEAARTDWAERLRRVPTAIGAGLLLIPAAMLACWPSPLGRSLARRRRPARQPRLGQPAPQVNAIVLALTALPVPTVALMALGVGHATIRLVARPAPARRGGVEAGDALAAGRHRAAAAGCRRPGAPAPRAGAGDPGAAAAGAARGPRPGGPGRSSPGRRGGGGGRPRWPSPSSTPGLRAAAVTFPHGASAWGEPLGGAAGAAWRGWPRQDGGEAIRGVLDDLSLHAAPGARVRWIGAAPLALERYRRAGLLRADLLEAPSVAEADLAVVARDGPRDEEYEVWARLRLHPGRQRPLPRRGGAGAGLCPPRGLALIPVSAVPRVTAARMVPWRWRSSG